MGKVKPGNKKNAVLNGEYGKHVRDLKKTTSGKRRSKNVKEIQEGIEDHESRYDEDFDYDDLINQKD